MDSVGRPKKFLFPNQKDKVTVFTSKDDIVKSKNLIEKNREWKENGDMCDFEEGKINVTHRYHTNLSLHYYHVKQKERPRGLVVCFHGLHSSQILSNSIIANVFGQRGYEVIGFDQEAHGRNIKEKKDRALIMSFRSLIMNTWCFLERFLEQEKERITPDIPIFMVGGSMGGSITISSLLEKEFLKKFPIAGAVIYCPGIENTQKPGFFTYSALKAMSTVKPAFLWGASGMDKDHSVNFKEDLEHFVNHPDSYDGPFKIRTGCEIIDLGDYVSREGHKIETPFLLMHGSKDNICKFQGSEKFFERAENVKDKLFVRLEGMMHAILQDHCSIEVARMTYHWINIRTNAHWRKLLVSKGVSMKKVKKRKIEEEEEEEECEGESSDDK